MREEYDFSSATRGLFYRGGRARKINGLGAQHNSHSRFEVFLGTDGQFRFRLRNDSATVYTSPDAYASKDDCIAAIAAFKQESNLAPTVILS
jgi:uncharacterized protein YegP (UPF0339 family)